MTIVTGRSWRFAFFSASRCPNRAPEELKSTSIFATRVRRQDLECVLNNANRLAVTHTNAHGVGRDAEEPPSRWYNRH